MEGKFVYILQHFYYELHPYIVREATHLRETISLDQRVSVTIWKLATNVDYRTLSDLFGIGKSTVCEIVNETCWQIVLQLLPKFLMEKGLKRRL